MIGEFDDHEKVEAKATNLRHIYVIKEFLSRHGYHAYALLNEENKK